MIPLRVSSGSDTRVIGHIGLYTIGRAWLGGRGAAIRRRVKAIDR